MASVYGTVDNVDAWVAMIAEDHYAGTSMGSLALTIMYKQFERLRDGDRFFFTGDPDLESDLVKSVIDLDALTLGHIIQWNAGVTRLQDNVFFVVPEPAAWLLAVSGATTIALARWSRRRCAKGADGVQNFVDGFS